MPWFPSVTLLCGPLYCGLYVLFQFVCPMLHCPLSHIPRHPLPAIWRMSSTGHSQPLCHIHFVSFCSASIPHESSFHICPWPKIRKVYMICIFAYEKAVNDIISHIKKRLYSTIRIIRQNLICLGQFKFQIKQQI